MERKIKGEIVLKNSHFRILSFLMFTMVMAMSTLSQASILKVCYDQWPPMTIFPTKEAPDRGVVIDMIEHIYVSKGYRLEFYEVPLARGLDMVSDGLCDMLPEYLYSKNSDNDFVYADEPTFAYDSAFVVRRDDLWRYTGVESLKSRRIATGPGWDYSSMSVDYQDYLDDPKNAEFVEVIAGYDDVVDRIFQMIKDNRVDIYADNELVLQYVLNQLDLNNELILVRPGLEKRLVEMPIFSKEIPVGQRQALIDIWNKGRLAIKGEQEESLLRKYQVSLDK
ncbi:MAG: transporter substrate-binding domain-containing protein [Oceanospirillaceae bacterium]|nr:transporter substrate-binding domain-containing protein [Oceanospirillaceae bacterium]